MPAELGWEASLAATIGVVGPGRIKLAVGVEMVWFDVPPMEPSFSSLGVELVDAGTAWPGAGEGGSECAFTTCPE